MSTELPSLILEKWWDLPLDGRVRDEHGHGYLSAGGGVPIFEIEWMGLGDAETVNRLAPVLAASTDMLAALRELCEVGIINPTGSIRLDRAVEAARAALAKAERRA